MGWKADANIIRRDKLRDVYDGTANSLWCKQIAWHKLGVRMAHSVVKIWFCLTAKEYELTADDIASLTAWKRDWANWNYGRRWHWGFSGCRISFWYAVFWCNSAANAKTPWNFHRRPDQGLTRGVSAKWPCLKMVSSGWWWREQLVLCYYKGSFLHCTKQCWPIAQHWHGELLIPKGLSKNVWVLTLPSRLRRILKNVGYRWWW